VKIAAGADHAGFSLKDAVVEYLRAHGHEVVDFGTNSDKSVDYPTYAHAVAGAVERGEVDRGLLVCGTGLGMCITANRHRGVRAADCLTPSLAEMSRRHNDANVLCLGGRVLDVDDALAITEVWLATAFEGGRHERRVELIDQSAETT
jgi:ribose 5-phosphate isomerase B